MSKNIPYQPLPVPHALGETLYAMSFEEIAAVEGISRQGVFNAYRSAIRKLQRKRKMADLVELAAELQQHRRDCHGHPSRR